MNGRESERKRKEASKHYKGIFDGVAKGESAKCRHSEYILYCAKYFPLCCNKP